MSTLEEIDCLLVWGLAGPWGVIDSSLTRWWYNERAGVEPHWPAQAMTTTPWRRDVFPKLVGQSNEKFSLQLKFTCLVRRG